VGSVGSGSSGTTAAATPQEKGEGQQTGGGAIDAVLLLMVKFVLAGVQGAVAVEWLLGKVLEALIWAVELGILLVQPPS
jgi:hypothetical protein